MKYCDLLSAYKKQTHSKQKMFSLPRLVAVCGSAILFLTVASSVLVGAARAQSALLSPVLTSPAEGAQYATPMPVFEGEAEGDEVRVFIDEQLNGRAPVREDGAFRYVPFLPLASGAHTVAIESYDRGTNEQSARLVRSLYIAPNPAPTLLVPDANTVLGDDRAWVGGVARNHSVVRVLIDGVEYVRTSVKNDDSGVGSFGVNLEGLSHGAHVVEAIARDTHGKDSFRSAPLSIRIAPRTPAPILMRPVVNADSGIERPFIVGVAKPGLQVSIVIDGRVAATFTPPSTTGEAASFAWQPTAPLSLGRHTIEAFASDSGKLSNNSATQFWQVGENVTPPAIQETPVSTPSAEETPQEETPPISVDEGAQDKEPIVVTPPAPDESTITVRDDTAPEAEQPVVPDVVVPFDDEGRVQADDEFADLFQPGGPTDSATSPEIQETPEGIDVPPQQPTEFIVDEGGVSTLAPGAVVREIEEQAEGTRVNTSLIVGIVILLFLLFSMVIWYMQEKKAALGDRVAEMFQEKEETPASEKDRTPSKDQMSMDHPAPPKKRTPEEEPPRDDFPPPPPPAF